MYFFYTASVLIQKLHTSYRKVNSLKIIEHPLRAGHPKQFSTIKVMCTPISGD